MKFLSSLLISLMVLVQFNSPAWSQSNNRTLRAAPLVNKTFRLKYNTKNQSPSTSSMRCCVGPEFLLCKKCIGGKSPVLEMQRAKKPTGK